MKTLPQLLGGLAGPPSVCSSAPNRLDVFAVGPDKLIWRWWLDGENWLGPAPIPVGPAIPPEGICAVSSGPGLIEVFAAAPGDNPFGPRNTPWWWRWNGTTWTTPSALPPNANLFPVPVSAVCSGPNNIDVVAAGLGNTPWWWHWNGTNWTSPKPLPSGANLPAVRIAVVSPHPGRLDVFAAGIGNQLWHWWREGTSEWSLPIDRGGNLPAEGVSAVSWGPNRIDVFAAARLPDGSNPLQHWWWDGGTQFNGPENLGGNLAAGTVSVVSSGPNRLDVFAISGDKRLARWRWDSSHWIGPNYVGDNLPSGDVSAVVLAQNHVNVFVRGAGNSLQKWPGGRLDNTSTQPWSNLAMNWQIPSVPNGSPIAPVAPLGQLVGHCYPESLDELVDIVKEAERVGRHVRAAGSSWSNSDVAITPDYLVETNKLTSELSGVLSATPSVLIVPKGNLLHVEAGITLGDLNILLDKRSLALPVLGGSSGQTLAGAISTSVHGANFRAGPLPDIVRAIHLVGPRGIQHWIEPSSGISDRGALSKAMGIDLANVHQDDNWFNSVLVSVGSLGIIYSFIIEAVPQYDLVENCEWLTWTAVRARLANGAPGNPFDVSDNRDVNVIVNPFTVSDGTRPCFLITRQAATATVPYSGSGSDMPGWFLKGIDPFIRLSFEANPATIDDIVTWQTRENYPQKQKRGLAHTVTTAAGTPPLRGLALEIAFDATNDAYLSFVDAACEILYTSYRDQQLGLAGWFSLRFVGQSRAYLSPQNRSRRTCMVEFAALQEFSHTPKLLALLEAEGRKHGGIQHWGMFDDLRASDVFQAYPHLNKWRQVRWEITNGGTARTFDNDFTHRCGLSQPPSDIPVPGNYDGDRQNDFAVWRPSEGNWYIIRSSDGVPQVQQWGQAGDIPVPGDYDGGNRIDFAVWRPNEGNWYIINSATAATRVQQWGQAGDIPVPGDYDGDGRIDFAIWRPGEGNWYIINSATATIRVQQWGQPGDIPVPGDYDGDGRNDFAVWRPSEGTWHIIRSSDGILQVQQWGQPGDIPVPGDYDGDGCIDFAVWRPSAGTWHIIRSSDGIPQVQQWGQAGDIPVPGDYDGDGRIDFAVWRPSEGNWYIINSATATTRVQQWGALG